MPKIVFVSLCEDSSRSKTGCVDFNSSGELRVIDLKYWLLTELRFKRVERMLLLRMPLPGHVFLREVMQWTCNTCKVLYEPPIEIGEPNETSDLFQSSRGCPISNRMNLARVHAYFSGCDNHPKIFHGLLFEIAFLRFKV